MGVGWDQAAAERFACTAYGTISNASPARPAPCRQRMLLPLGSPRHPTHLLPPPCQRMPHVPVLIDQLAAGQGGGRRTQRSHHRAVHPHQHLPWGGWWRQRACSLGGLLLQHKCACRCGGRCSNMIGHAARSLQLVKAPCCSLEHVSSGHTRCNPQSKRTCSVTMSMPCSSSSSLRHRSKQAGAPLSSRPATGMAG